MCRSSLLVLLTLAILNSSGCQMLRQLAGQPRSEIQLASYATDEPTGERTIHVLGHGWHTGLVLRTADISPEIWPDAEQFQTVDFVEIGWGDEGFYTADRITPGLVAKAGFWPTPSVMHVAGFEGDVTNVDVYQFSDIVEVRVTGERFDELCRFINDSFARDDNGESIRLGPGLYGLSRFYRANGSYYLPKTCNFWTARALDAAGCPMIPLSGATAESILFQTRRFGRVVQESPDGLKTAVLQAGGSE